MAYKEYKHTVSFFDKLTGVAMNILVKYKAHSEDEAKMKVEAYVKNRPEIGSARIALAGDTEKISIKRPVGRPTGNRKIPISVQLPREVLDWMDEQDDSRSVLIEKHLPWRD